MSRLRNLQRLWPQPQSRLRRGALWFLLCALLLSPALGRWHEALHGYGSVPAGHTATDAFAVPNAHGSETQTPNEASSSDFFAQLFDGHKHATCVLLDQASLAHALPSMALVLPVVLPQVCPAAAAASVLARRHEAHFYARGPPLARVSG